MPERMAMAVGPCRRSAPAGTASTASTDEGGGLRGQLGLDQRLIDRLGCLPDPTLGPITYAIGGTGPKRVADS